MSAPVRQRVERAERTTAAGRLARILAGALALAGVEGCCSWFPPSYEIHLATDRDAHSGGPTDLLIAFATEETVRDFREARSIDEARDILRREYDPDDPHFLEIDSVPPDKRHDIRHDRRSDEPDEELYVPCDATHVFVFTSIDGAREIERRLGDDFDGHLNLHVRERTVDFDFKVRRDR